MEEDRKYNEKELEILVREAEKQIDVKYVEKVLEEIKRYIDSEIEYENVTFLRKIKSYLRRKPWIKESIKYVASPALTISLLYAFTDRVLDNYFIGIDIGSEKIKSWVVESLKERNFNYIEFINPSQVKTINSFASKMGKEINFPLMFSMVNPNFASVSSFLISLFSSYYFVKKRHLLVASLLPILVGFGFTLSYMLSLPYLPLFAQMLSTGEPAVIMSVPKLIRKIYFDLSSLNPFVSTYSVSPILFSALGGLIGGGYALFKGLRERITHIYEHD